VETGEIAAAGVADASIKTPADLNAAAEQIVEKMFKRAPPPAPPSAYMPPPPPTYIPPPAYAPAPQPIIIAQPAVNTSNPRTDIYEELHRKYEDICGPDGAAWISGNKTYCKSLLSSYREGISSDDFSSGQRWGTYWLNNLVPGLGSFTIMNDNTGGIVQMVLGVVGYACIFSGESTDERYYEYSYYGGGYYDEETYLNAAFYIGWVALAGNFIFNIVRSSTYHKPYHKPAQLYGSAEDAGLKWAVFPDRNGDMKAGLGYSANF
jgi:hypothetical protein